MKTQLLTCGLFVLALLAGQALAQERAPGLIPPVIADAKDLPKQKEKEKEKDKDKDKDKKITEPPKTDIFVEAPLMGPQFPTGFNPQMLGEKHTFFVRRNLVIGGTTTTTNTSVIPGGSTNSTTKSVSVGRRVIVPAPHHGAFNIAENGSPMPQDRVFVFWNHYHGLGLGDSGLNAPVNATASFNQVFRQNNQIRVDNITINTVIPGAPRVDYDREVFGIEKTFLDGYFSIELRAPLLHMGGGDANFGTNTFGDLTIIGKYALYLDRAQGNVISTGLGITVPTGRSIETNEGNFHDVLLQPYLAYLWNFDRFYVQGFSSFVFPTNKNDVTQAFNSLGVNYWLYRGSPDRLLTFIVPTVEAHVTTPLNHRDMNGPIIVPDAVVLTAGVHLGIGRNTTLSFGAARPMTGSLPYNIEGFVQLNMRY